MNKSALLEKLELIKAQHGEWSYDIPLPFGIWTKGNMGIPHTRLKRFVQIVSDITGKPIQQTRVLDLGCLDGMFSVEFATQGAETIGLEIREDNISKAIFCQEALGLSNLKFIKGDARNISMEELGEFDAIICSGLLYHLTGTDAIELIRKMYAMTKKLVIIDTHISLKPESHIVFNEKKYFGKIYKEHSSTDSQETKSKRLWASWDNENSFWVTRPSLINILNEAGFSSVYESFLPAHINFGKPGIEHLDRCTFVCIKGKQLDLFTSPTANNLVEGYPEDSLKYSPSTTRYGRLVSFFRKKVKQYIGI